MKYSRAVSSAVEIYISVFARAAAAAAGVTSASLTSSDDFLGESASYIRAKCCLSEASFFFSLEAFSPLCSRALPRCSPSRTSKRRAWSPGGFSPSRDFSRPANFRESRRVSVESRPGIPRLDTYPTLILNNSLFPANERL